MNLATVSVEANGERGADRRRVAILGDIGEAVARSAALRDFVRESNRGRHVWFVADRMELERRLAKE